MVFKSHDGCEECRHRGFLHMVDPFEIQRCDACSPSDFTDDDAIELHRIRCGCDWPEHDYPHVFGRALEYRVNDVALEVAMERFSELAYDREGFKTNIGRLAAAATEVVRAFRQRSRASNSDEYILKEIDWIAETLKKLLELMKQNKLPDHWFWSLGEGTYDAKKDIWIARTPPATRTEEDMW